jgi:predicted MFS family arabinose efflux permease
LNTQPTTLLRDRLTWLGYFFIAYLAYGQSVLGPSLPFIRAERGYDYNQTSLHLVLFALGSLLAGLFGARFITRFGLSAATWGSSVFLLVGYVIISVGQNIFPTTFGCLISGFFASISLQATQTILTNRHGPRRAIAITEANIAASIAATTAPFLVSSFERIGITWRGGIYIMVVLLLVVWPLARQISFGAGQAGPSQAKLAPEQGQLPRLFWLFALALSCGTAVEWSITYWGGDFLEKSVGLLRVDATSLMSLFFLAMLIGRVVGSRLTLRFQSQQLLLAAYLLTLVGFLAFWQGKTVWLNVAGLFVSGLGIANFYPMGITSALSIAVAKPVTASARAGTFVALSVLIVPTLLGSLASVHGIAKAFGLVLLIAVLGTMVSAAATRGKSNVEAEATAPPAY